MDEAIQFLPEAVDDVREAALFYQGRVSGLGSRFRKELNAVLQTIALNPLIKRERSGGYRRANMPSFPFYIVFILEDDKIIIVSVAHSSRNPAFWQSRKI